MAHAGAKLLQKSRVFTQSIASLSASILLFLGLFFLWSCETLIEEGFDVPYEGDKLIVEGHISPDFSAVRLSRTLNPNLSYFESAARLDSIAIVSLHAADGTLLDTLRYDGLMQWYSSTASLATNQAYYLQCSYPNFPAVQTEPLVFAPALTEVTIFFDDEAFESEPNVHGLLASGVLAAETYYHAIALVEDPAPGTNRAAYLFVDYDDVFRDQCGISSEIDNQISWSSRCIGQELASIDLFHGYTTSSFPDLFSNSIPYPSPPSRIGLRFGSITEKDYRYALSQRKSNNFFDEYLTAGRVELTQTNVQNGYGWVYAVNSQDYWMDL